MRRTSEYYSARLLVVHHRASYFAPARVFFDIKGIFVLHNFPVRLQLDGGRIKLCKFGGIQDWVSRPRVGNTL
jgi:hypothetical protein